MTLRPPGRWGRGRGGALNGSPRQSLGLFPKQTYGGASVDVLTDRTMPEFITPAIFAITKYQDVSWNVWPDDMYVVGSSGLIASSTTTNTITLPAGGQATDQIYLAYAFRPDDIYSTPFDYIQTATAINGTAASGNGTGSVRVASFKKLYGFLGETDPVFSHNPAPDISMGAALILRPRKFGRDSVVPVGSSGTAIDTTTTGTTLNYTNWSPAQFGVKPGDLVVIASGRPDDVATETSVVVTPPSGITISAVTQQLATTTTVTGFDGALYVYTFTVLTTNFNAGGAQASSAWSMSATTGSGDADGTMTAVTYRVNNNVTQILTASWNTYALTQPLEQWNTIPI